MAATGLLVEIGDRLRLRREKLGLTQKEAAKLLEMSETFYGEIERGNRRLSIEKMILVRERMGISLTWLLAGRRPADMHEVILRQYPEEKAERVERLLKNLARLYE
ncbi:MAG TPA: helix-turn-helix domain-containing protein [Candidatus Eisenbergiella intestinipullorum]|nr:helix-turn-helix domain-containing protein [Candidatus Eisenbergiella intestinipullorum]